jgi:Suppressor of fused protein (SUFU).
MVLKKNKKDEFPKFYEEDEVECIETHIKEQFGNFDNVFHELFSPDIHVDITIVDPTPERDYYTLVTMGMGAHRMNTPPELAEYKLERAEMMICLPSDWDIHNDDETWYWPIRWLKIMARLPIEHDTWLGWGHTVPNDDEPFAENTGFECMMLLNPIDFEESSCVCKLPNGDEVNFYQLFPLYKGEMQYKLDNDADALLELFDDEDKGVVDIYRKSVCDDGNPEPKLSFAERTSLFWEWFEKSEKKISKMIDDKSEKDSEAIVSLISEGVSIISDKIYFNIGGKNEFTFSVDGKTHLFYLLPYVVSKMPSKFSKKWNFFPYMNGTNGKSFSIRMNGLDVAADKTFILLTPAENGKYELEYYSESFSSAEDERGSVFFTLMNNIVGEGLTYMCIDGISYADSKKDGMIPLTEMEEKLRSGMEEALPTDLFEPYDLEPDDDDPALRYDVGVGMTNYPGLIDGYYNGNGNAYTSLSRMGASPIFLYFCHNDEYEKCAEECEKIADLLKKSILNDNEGYGVYLGYAIGTKCGYIDMLIFDMDRFALEASGILRDIPRSFFASFFYKQSDSLYLVNDSLDRISEIDILHNNNLHYEITLIANSVPTDDWDYNLKGRYARALNNLSEEEAALKMLESIAEEGKDDGVWHYRVGYSLFYLDREEEAFEHLQQAIDLGEESAIELRDYFLEMMKDLEDNEDEDEEDSEED